MVVVMKEFTTYFIPKNAVLRFGINDDSIEVEEKSHAFVHHYIVLV